MVERRNVLRQELNVTLWSSLRIYLVSSTRKVNLLFTNDVRNTLVVDQISRSVGEGEDRLPVRCGEIVKLSGAKDKQATQRGAEQTSNSNQRDAEWASFRR